MRSVKAGDRTYDIQPFRGLKALEAAELVARIMDAVPGLMTEVSEFSREYAEKNAERITVDEVRYQIAQWDARRLSGEEIPKTAWEVLYESGAFNDRGFIQTPKAPSPFEQVGAVFPKVIKGAKEDTLRLLALVLIPNGNLKDADKADRIDEELYDLGRELLYEADLTELVEIVVVGIEVLQEQLAPAQASVGKLTRLLRGRQNGSSQENEEPQSQTSSTDSPKRTAGRAKKSSTESVGVN